MRYGHPRETTEEMSPAEEVSALRSLFISDIICHLKFSLEPNIFNTFDPREMRRDFNACLIRAAFIRAVRKLEQLARSMSVYVVPYNRSRFDLIGTVYV